MTKTQLINFIRIRNRSKFDSNLQFALDAKQAGFKVSELGEANKRLGSNPFYYWNTPFGILVERWGRLRLFSRPNQAKGQRHEK